MLGGGLCRWWDPARAALPSPASGARARARTAGERPGGDWRNKTAGCRSRSGGRVDCHELRAIQSNALSRYVRSRRQRCRQNGSGKAMASRLARLLESFHTVGHFTLSESSSNTVGVKLTHCRSPAHTLSEPSLSHSTLSDSDWSPAPQGLLSPRTVPSPFPWVWVRPIVDRDNRNLVNPIMRVTNYITNRMSSLNRWRGGCTHRGAAERHGVRPRRGAAE